MSRPVTLALVSVLLVGTGCTSIRQTVRERVPHGSDVAVIMFRDCTLSGPEACGGSGLSAGAVFARVLSEDSLMQAVPLSRPVSATLPLDDSAAVAYGRKKGFPYVVNGEVEDYHRVTLKTLRPERAGVSVRLLDTWNGQVMAFLSERGTAPNFISPDAILRRFAKRFRQSVMR